MCQTIAGGYGSVWVYDRQSGLLLHPPMSLPHHLTLAIAGHKVTISCLTCHEHSNQS